MMAAMRDFQSPNRSVVYAPNAMAATSHPRATLAAVEMLRAGGNAVDAAVTAVAALGVLEPQMTGIGGDCFVLYAPAGKDVIAYNGSGRAPAAATAEWYRERQIHQIETPTPHSVTVPGAVEAWHRLITDHGTKDFAEVLQPAIELAENGYPVAPRVAFDWARLADHMARTETARRVYLPGGGPPNVGDRVPLPELAGTLRDIAAKGPDGFYTGRVAEDMVATLQRHGGLHTLDDFAAARGEYVTPIKTGYRGYEILECPPNGQGLIALIMLNILEGFDFGGGDPLGVRRLHLESEAARLAYRDRDAYLADPAKSGVPTETLLSEAYAAEQRLSIREDRAMAEVPGPSLAPSSDTVYLTVVDADGNAISFINSVFSVFGSGIVSDSTGVLFHNRGSSFVTQPGHPNAIGPGKRPMHTIMPGMLAKDGEVVMPFGVMGGHFQPFGHTHIVTNIIDFGLDVQRAIETPRIFHFDGELSAESGVPDETLGALAAMGHKVGRSPVPHGGGQAIWIDRARGVLAGGSDPRKDGMALGY
jgi:gamma-glutamyltranspeptidase/glutathione hydrolase